MINTSLLWLCLFHRLSRNKVELGRFYFHFSDNTCTVNMRGKSFLYVWQLEQEQASERCQKLDLFSANSEATKAFDGENCHGARIKLSRQLKIGDVAYFGEK